mmetsp:Transcript_71891/g.164862  ORF Transcript_71891/g.164862 Transcript_71891/m.164862 type:complete len:375 (-) Transcript_71891:9-1133(-)
MLLGEPLLDGVPRVGDTQHSVAKSGDHLASGQGVLGKLGQQLRGGLLVTQNLAGVLQPPETLLVSQPVQGPGQAADTSGVSGVGVAQGAAHQVGGVGGDVTSLVVSMDHEVQPNGVLELLRIIHPQHMSIIARPVQGGVRGDVLPVKEHVAVDAGRHDGDLGDQGQGILQHIIPVLRLLHPLVVGGGERAARLQGQEGDGQLGHGMGGLIQIIDHLQHVGRHHSPGVQLSVECLHLRVRGDLIGQQQPVSGLRQANLTGGVGLGELLHTLVQGAVSVEDATLIVQARGLVDHGLDPSHPTHGHLHIHVPDVLEPMLLLEGLELGGLLLGQGLDPAREGGHDVGGGKEPALSCYGAAAEHGWHRAGVGLKAGRFP